MTKLNSDEQDLLESYERNEWRSVATSEEIHKYREAAQRTSRKDKRVNIRMSKMDIDLLQERALIEGLPYQTLMSSILHKYVTGRLVEKD